MSLQPLIWPDQLKEHSKDRSKNKDAAGKKKNAAKRKGHGDKVEISESRLDYQVV